jgi:hypothetical protein
MKHVDTYDKTVNGKNEVTDNAAGLSMMERRVLILVNGENEVEKLAKLSLCDDIDATLDRLLELRRLSKSRHRPLPRRLPPPTT